MRSARPGRVVIARTAGESRGAGRGATREASPPRRIAKWKPSGSRQPEILSHVSPVLVLSVQEFREWLTRHPGARSFAALYQGVYGDAAELTPAQLQDMRSRGMIVLGDARPPSGGRGALL